MILARLFVVITLTIIPLDAHIPESPLKYVHPFTGSVVYDVTKYGAKGDNKTLDTKAIQSAIYACTNSSTGGIVLFPQPGVFLVEPLYAEGQNCALKVEPLATIIASSWKGHEHMAMINLHNCQNFSIFGGGTIDGNGPFWWGKPGSDRPRLLNVKDGDTIAIYNVTFVDSANHNLEIGANNAEVAKVNILVRWDRGSGPNTDGIDVHGTPFFIHDCHIDVGDDNIAVHASNVLVEDCLFGGKESGVHGHGASIGSLGSGSKIENVTFRNIEFLNTHVGPNIKVHTDAVSGYVRNVTYENLQLHAMQKWNLRINSYYGAKNPPIHSKKSTFKISDIFYRNITADHTKELGFFLCSETIPCTNIYMDHVHFKGDSPKPWQCTNATGTMKDTVPLSCLSKSSM